MQSKTLLAALLGGLTSIASAAARQKVLVYTRTVDFRHDSIPTAIEVIKELGNSSWPGFDVVATEDQHLFEDREWLWQFDALLLVSASGEILGPRGQLNMMKYIESGGGYMGVHEACGALFHQPWYGRLVGAYFDYHPEICHATLDVADHDHPSVSFLNDTWEVYDEMYNYLNDPRAYGRTVVLTVDESSYHDPVKTKAERAKQQGSPHPIAWYKEGGLLDAADFHVGGGTDNNRSVKPWASGGEGRSFFTALGHSNETWHDDVFRQHFLGGLYWVLNSTSIRSSSSDSLSWRPGQEWEALPPFPVVVANVSTAASDPHPEHAMSASGTAPTFALASSGVAMKLAVLLGGAALALAKL